MIIYIAIGCLLTSEIKGGIAVPIIIIMAYCSGVARILGRAGLKLVEHNYRH